MSIQSVQTTPATGSAIKAAIEEARETTAETAKEAAHGDRQAKRLLAKRAAANEAISPSKPVTSSALPPTVNTLGQVTGGGVNTTA